MIIMALDPATNIGWAVYDIGTSTSHQRPSSIECGSFNLGKGSAFEKVKAVRALLPPLIKKYQPDFIVFEMPLSIIPKFEKKGKDLAGDTETTTINAGTILQLNRISGAVQAVIEGFRIPCEEVRAQTWQSIIPKNIRADNPKKRAALFCDMLNIVGKNNDARDAAVIALWAAGRSQELKLKQMAENVP